MRDCFKRIAMISRVYGGECDGNHRPSKVTAFKVQEEKEEDAADLRGILFLGLCGYSTLPIMPIITSSPGREGKGQQSVDRIQVQNLW